MLVEQVRYRSGHWHGASALDATWVLAFGATDVLRDPAVVAELARRYPRAALQGCSTAGAVEGTRIDDDTLTVTAIRFADTRVRVEAVALDAGGGAHAVGAELARRLAAPDLVHVFVLSEGIDVNGTALIDGLHDVLPPTVTVSGGLAADGARMTHTVVLAGHDAVGGRVSAAGLYGVGLEVRCGSLGGWAPFGPERVITRSAGNVLQELDDQPALELYQRYLGSHADELPQSGLLFPLELRPPDGGAPVTRTLLAIDRNAGSITFAGDMPVGHVVRLMHSNIDRLVDGATAAAQACAAPAHPELAVIVSCAGRRVVMGQRTEEELEALTAVLGAVPMCGFYSNGELSPAGAEPCALHNQTMTVTTLRER